MAENKSYFTKIIDFYKKQKQEDDEEKKKEEKKEQEKKEEKKKEEKKEEKKKEEKKEDSSLPWITQKADIGKKCEAGFERFIHESNGRIKVEGKLFNDLSFPANDRALDWTKKVTMEWKRPTEIEKSPSLWGSKGIRPAAINQGSLGDCWLLASMAALAEWPERIQKVFDGYKDYPTNGQIVTKFWLYGKENRVTIDDRLPGKTYYKRFYTSYTRKSPNGAWWGPLLEKASAKFFGTYDNLVSGS